MNGSSEGWGKGARVGARGWVLGLLLVGLLMRPVQVGAAGGQSLDLGFGVSSLYDDNPIQYSGSQLSLFESGTKPDQFSIETSDDVLWAPYISMTWSNDRGRGRSRSLSLRGSGEFHQKNKTADFHAMSGSWRESFSSESRLTVSGYRLPHFYLRQLFDEDAIPAFSGLSKYRRAEFGLTIGSAAWRQRVSRKMRAEISYQYEHRGYNRDFIERTSNTHQGELGLEWYRLPRRGAVNLFGGYRKSHARGEDGDELLGATPDDRDVSYHGIVAGIGGRMTLIRGERWGLGGDLRYELGTRVYDSNRPADKDHFGRNDTSHAVDATLRLKYSSHLSVRGLYRFDHNTARLGAAASPTSEVGDYTENQVGLALDWSGSLWRQSRGSVGTEGDSN